MFLRFFLLEKPYMKKNIVKQIMKKNFKFLKKIAIYSKQV